MVQRRRTRRPSPAMTVALLALLVALSGTAVAAGVVPLAKRALSADNAKKLGGKTAAQVAALPGPAASAAGLVSVQPGTFSLAAATSTAPTFNTFSVACPSGAKAVSGGYSSQQDVSSFDTTISSDGLTWSVLLVSFDTNPASGSLYAVCVR